MAVKLVRVYVQISGMTCASCVHYIETEMMKQNGVLSASVALATSHGRFSFDSKTTGVRNIIDTINVSASLTNLIIMCTYIQQTNLVTLLIFLENLESQYQICKKNESSLCVNCFCPFYIWPVFSFW